MTAEECRIDFWLMLAKACTECETGSGISVTKMTIKEFADFYAQNGFRIVYNKEKVVEIPDEEMINLKNCVRYEG